VCSTLQFLTITPTHVASLSLHDALPISNTGDIGGDFVAVGETDTGDLPQRGVGLLGGGGTNGGADASLLGRRQIGGTVLQGVHTDRKSTRLNSSHVSISYAVFCLKKKNS